MGDEITSTMAPPRARPNRATNLLRLVPYLGPYKVRWTAMFVAALISLGATIAIPLFTKAVIDGPITHHDQRGLFRLGFVALGVLMLEPSLMFVRRWLVSRATMGVEADIRKELYARLQLLPMSFHGKWQSGQLLSRIMNDLGVVRRLLGFGIVFLVLNTVQIVVVTGILFTLYWPLAVVVLVSAVPITATVLYNQRVFTRLSRAAQDQSGEVATVVEESALGVRVIRSFGREEHAFQRFDERARKLYDLQLAKVNLQARFWTTLEVIPNLTLVIVLGLGATAAGQHRVTLGTLVAFITMMLSLVWPIATMGFILSMTQEAMTAADRIAEVFDTPLEITDGSDHLEEPRGRLELRNVGFRFPDTAETDGWALRHLDLTIEPGETIALVGATGAGKSVLTSLIPRLYDVTEGSIRIDGVDVRDLPLVELRSLVATAFEDPTLFSMSVRENLTLGRPDATEDAIAQAIDIAQAGFVRDLPFGLETRIGEQGMSLSGGQRQRLSLARAVLSGPRILVLDDTLSALDVHTEKLVEEALGRVLSDVTGLVVAHRASTVMLADRVALLQDGTITHVGTHAELLANVPAYRFLLSADDELQDGHERSTRWGEDSEDDERREIARAEAGTRHGESEADVRVKDRR